MLLTDIIELLNLELIFPAKGEMKINTACGADLMSDVLAFSQEKTMLLTGLTNPQVIRTAEMTDIRVIVFVRGKRPLAETVELARDKGIYLYLSPKTLFECCGLLYEHGMKPENIRDIK